MLCKAGTGQVEMDQTGIEFDLFAKFSQDIILSLFGICLIRNTIPRKINRLKLPVLRKHFKHFNHISGDYGVPTDI